MGFRTRPDGRRADAPRQPCFRRLATLRAVTAPALSELDRGFRSSYLDYATLTAQLRAWAEALPELCRLTSIGRTDEGRELWLLTIGREPERRRPAVWIDGNMHACELAGSSVALAIAEDALRLLSGGEAHGLMPHVRDRLDDVLFYVLPRMSPDGAECVLASGRYVRSLPRDRRPNQEAPRWRRKDLDGDGLSLMMRLPHPAGEFVESAAVPGLMVARRLDDPPPYYKLFPEGDIEPWDGSTIPDPHYLSDNEVDLNRNFPFAWMPSHTQAGAGGFPASEPEARAVVEFATAHPEIFAWLNLHTYGGVFIRPLGDKPDSKMDQDDLALYRQLGAWAEELTGYPMVSGFEEFLYEPDVPIYGDLSEYAYHQRGAVAYVVELWDLMKRLGMERPKKFVDYYAQLGRKHLEELFRFDREHNAGRIFRPWHRFDHPQLGPLELGGMDPRVGVWNPPYELLGEVCQQHAAHFLRVAALAPAVRVRRVGRERIGELTRVTVAIENHGYLATHGLSSAKKLDWNEPLWARAEASGCALVDPADGRREVGHLAGWGRGLGAGEEPVAYAGSKGSATDRTLVYLVRGSGTLAIEVGSCRVGWQRHLEEI
jgi:hypothetical protein